jgi:hypothetical protein
MLPRMPSKTPTPIILSSDTGENKKMNDILGFDTFAADSFLRELAMDAGVTPERLMDYALSDQIDEDIVEQESLNTMCQSIGVRFNAVLDRFQEEAIRHAKGRIYEIVSRAGECKSVRAAEAVVVLLDLQAKSSVVCSFGGPAGLGYCISLDSVPVFEHPIWARQQRCFTGTDLEELKRCGLVSKRAKLAITTPIFDGAGNLIGTCLTASISSESATGIALRRLAAATVELAPHLMVLRACHSGGELYFPWHPEIHGGDLSKLLGELCRVFVESIDCQHTKCGIWYPHWEQECLTMYAACGYDLEFYGEQILRMQSAIGAHLKSGCAGPVCYDPFTDAHYQNTAKARELGIVLGIRQNVFSTNANECTPIAAVSAYLTEGMNDNEMAICQGISQKALDVLSELVGSLICNYKKLVGPMRVACVGASMAKFESESLDQCSQRARLAFWLKTLCKVFDAEAGSIYAFDEQCNCLRCVATTGFQTTVCKNGTRYVDLDNHPMEEVIIDLNRQDRCGHTQCLWLNSDRTAFYRTCLQSPFKEELLPGRPVVGGVTKPEYIAGENEECFEASDRRLVASKLIHKGLPVGVVRLVRRAKDRSFNQCDVTSLAEACCRYGGLIDQRMKELREDCVTKDA